MAKLKHAQRQFVVWMAAEVPGILHKHRLAARRTRHSNSQAPLFHQPPKSQALCVLQHPPISGPTSLPVLILCVDRRLGDIKESSHGRRDARWLPGRVASLKKQLGSKACEERRLGFVARPPLAISDEQRVLCVCENWVCE